MKHAQFAYHESIYRSIKISSALELISFYICAIIINEVWCKNDTRFKIFNERLTVIDMQTDVYSEKVYVKRDRICRVRGYT